MNRAVKIAIGVGGTAALLGGIGYLARSKPKPSAKKTKVPTFKVASIIIPIWNEAMRPRAEDAARKAVKSMGTPEWTAERNLEAARLTAALMYPKSKLTKNDGWPDDLRTSETWVAEGKAGGKSREGAEPWRYIWYIAGEALGHVPIT